MASLKKRGSIFYIQYYSGPRQHRVCTGTDSLQLAKEKLRQFESGQLRGDDSPLPTKTPLADALSAYVQHVRAVKTPKSAQTDVYYLREIFGPIVPALQITSRRPSASTRTRPVLPGHDRRRRAKRIEATHMEDVTTADVSAFISGHMQSRCLAPKTATRLPRLIESRLRGWPPQGSWRRGGRSVAVE